MYNEIYMAREKKYGREDGICDVRLGEQKGHTKMMP